jgi:hypothetical protein
MEPIELVYDNVQGERGRIILIHARAGDKVSDILASRPVGDNESEDEAVVKTVEFLFAEPDTWDEVEQLRGEFETHTHGQPGA